MKFRLLKASEIECRISTVKNNGVSALLYKDARVDQNILDETVGPMNWQRHHSRDNANCIVSIWDAEKNQWIEKEDTGKESNTEKEKGLASDSFKRACFNWGIGRELYSAPFIWISEATIEKDGKCFDRFEVKNIAYNEEREISELTIINSKTKKVVFTMGGTKTPEKAPSKSPEKSPENAPEEKKELKASPKQIELLKKLVPTAEKQAKMLEYCGVEKIEDISAKQASEIITAKTKTNKEEKKNG